MSGLEKEVRQRVHEMQDEWWSTSAEETFVDIGVELAGHYFHDVDKTIDVLGALLSAAQSEFGV